MMNTHLTPDDSRRRAPAGLLPRNSSRNSSRNSLSKSASRLSWATLLSAAVLFAGCSAMTAQNPSSTLRPVNAVADGADERVMLKGADLTAYFTQGKYLQGSPQFKSVFESVTFRFASAENKALFDAAPRKYLPQYGGYCASGTSFAIPWGGDADVFKMIDGKLYIFGGAASRDAFELDVPGNIKLADKYWGEEIAGSHSWFQRYKRMVIRVPHYKSGEELARRVAEAKAKKN